MVKLLKWRRRAAFLASLKARAVNYSLAKYCGIKGAGHADFVTQNAGGLAALFTHDGGTVYAYAAWWL